ncbi:hypothetical protein [Burkholderia sp. BCC1644]|uniref:hypothetical protein n=1 Tax=Burkholderia sp. BCC1644 TaxID=2676293 RepID=UPI001591FFC6|nr:hypothetical protein [Burkholderia sp. BCC1644]
MELQSDKMTLVIAGAWNPAILTPQWIAQHVLGFPADRDFQVGVELPIQEYGQAPRFSFESLSVMATPATLLFALNADDRPHVQKTFEVAAKVLELLPHTPVSGVGVNFMFTDTKPDANVATTFRSHDGVLAKLPDEEQNATIVQQSWQATVKLSDHLANVNCIKRGDRFEVAINHHFNVSSAVGAKRIVENPEAFDTLLGLSRIIIDGLDDGEK